MYDGANVARGHGATIQRFRHNDAEHLETLVKASTMTPRVIAVDGVNSMTGNAPDVKEFARIARENDAILYIDDAHGFGVIGERSPEELCDWGLRGNGVVRHQERATTTSCWSPGSARRSARCCRSSRCRRD